MLNGIYERTVLREKNGVFLLMAIIISGLMVAVTWSITQVTFYEVYKTTGTVVPKHTRTLSINFDAFIDTNAIKVGNSYPKGAVLVEFNQQRLERDKAYYRTLLSEKQKQYDKMRNVASKVELDGLWFEIQDAIYRLSNIEESLKEASVSMPYDGIVIASAYEGMPTGFIPKGSALALTAATESLTLRVPITEHWTEKVAGNKDTIIKTKNAKYTTHVEEVVIIGDSHDYQQYAHIALLPELQTSLNPGTTVIVHIITDQLTILDMIARSFR